MQFETEWKEDVGPACHARTSCQVNARENYERSKHAICHVTKKKLKKYIKIKKILFSRIHDMLDQMKYQNFFLFVSASVIKI